ncbi:Gfo/Idh/MocA family oxidoreductase [Kribbella sp. NPDC048915]|uniref:Gfo/Idh/MocA family protein n=1 Tax=Kribbella sp. NPDC048915 TaxID=3155148 RepID=UPI0033E82D2D
MANLRAGLIGLGMMGRHHARVLASLEGVDLVAVADPGGDKFGVAGGRPVHENIEQLIAEKLDYCMVAVPTQYHAEIAKALAEAGVHAMIEKPLAGSTAEATEIAKAFEAAGLIGAVGHIERYNPALQALRTRLENGELGEIYQITTRRQGPFPARIADVGVTLDLATHDIDLTAWVTRSPFVSVAAQTAHKSGRQFEDLIAVTGKLADGTVTSHLINWLSPMKERLTVVTGEKGAFIADTLLADLSFHANGTVATAWDDVAHFRGVSEGDMIRYAISKPEPLRTEHEAFRDAVLGKEADIVTLQQGLATVQVAEAALLSAAENRTVTIDGES